MLTEAQKLIVANHLATNKNVQPTGSGKTFLELMGESNYQAVAKYCNKKTNPPVTVWKPSVTRDEVINAINFNEYINLTAAKRDAAAAFLLCTNFDFTVNRVRANITDIFGESDTKTKIFSKCDRVATNLEALFTADGVSQIYGYEIDESELREIFSLAKPIIKNQ